jgi:hypothetical protein
VVDLTTFRPSAWINASVVGDENQYSCIISDTGTAEFERDDGKKEVKLIVHFEGDDRALVLNKGNEQVLRELYGSVNTEEWHGKPIGVRNEPTQQMDGSIKGGVKLRRVEHLMNPIVGPPGTHPDSTGEDNLPF